MSIGRMAHVWLVAKRMPHVSLLRHAFTMGPRMLSTETYDSNGNTLTTGSNSFAYDSENRLTSMNSGTVQSIYDGDGERAAKTVSSVTTKYLVDDLSPAGYPQVVEEVSGGAVQRQYSYGLQLIDQQQVISSTWTPRFYEYDAGGSVRQLTDSSDSATDTYAYDAFGNKLNSTGTTPNNYLYRGEQYDSDLGLQYLRERYYNPTTGRFVSKDPYAADTSNPVTLHKYLYTGANPVSWRDPSGLDLEEVTLTDKIESEGEIEEEKEIAEDESCILNATADTLTAIGSGNTDASTLIGVAINFRRCKAKAPRKTGCCFAEGTPVHERDGDVPIEEVKEGDEVLARNNETGKAEYERVTALTPKHQDHLVDIRIEGEQTALRPSTSHPFWVKRGNSPNGQWLAAGQMHVGDDVQTIQGQWRRVVAIAPETELATVYNFTVDKDHDYFVGETGFLVHNANCGCQKHHNWPKYLGGPKNGL